MAYNNRLIITIITTNNMRKTTHTPGPWAWQSFGCGNLLIAQHGRRPVVLGAITDLEKHCAPAMNKDGRLELVDPDHPNARLIAAAPDLLAACKQLIECDHYVHFAVRLNNQEMKGIDMIKEAIVKAEGGQNG